MMAGQRGERSGRLSTLENDSVIAKAVPFCLKQSYVVEEIAPSLRFSQ
jgi:hypothetical protein